MNLLSKLSSLRREPGIWIFLLLALGLLLRLRQYVFNRSLWHDEILLVSTFAERGMSELVFQPLGNNQAAPIAFLVIVKVLTLIWGNNEWALRLLPLVCGIGALWMARPMARLLFPSALAQVTLVGLMAVSPVLVYYSSEFKQYQGDVLCTLLVLWVTLRFDPQRWQKDAALLAATGAACVWLSHPVDFVLAGCGLTLWLELARRKEWRAWMAVTGAGLAWVLSFALVYWISLKSLPDDGYLAAFWDTSFAPLPPTDLQELGWYAEAAQGFVYLGMHQIGTAFREVLPGWFHPAITVLLFVALAGAVCLFMQQRRAAIIALLTLLVTLVASSLHLYPFRARLLMFLLPFLFLSYAALVQQIHASGSSRLRTWWALAAAVAVLAMPLRISAAIFRHPINYQDMRGALQYVAAHREPGDNAMFSSWTYHFYNYYAPRVGLKDMPQYVYQPTANERHNILSSVRRICSEPSSARTWVVATNQVVAKNKAFFDALYALATPISIYQMEGGAVLLFDFRTTSFCQRYRSSPGPDAKTH